MILNVPPLCAALITKHTHQKIGPPKEQKNLQNTLSRLVEVSKIYLTINLHFNISKCDILAF